MLVTSVSFLVSPLASLPCFSRFDQYSHSLPHSIILLFSLCSKFSPQTGGLNLIVMIRHCISPSQNNEKKRWFYAFLSENGVDGNQKSQYSHGSGLLHEQPTLIILPHEITSNLTLYRKLRKIKERGSQIKAD